LFAENKPAPFVDFARKEGQLSGEKHWIISIKIANYFNVKGLQNSVVHSF
jgi:hypothetical protein